jgi:NAD(P)H-dependent nitrite reductase small subunit
VVGDALNKQPWVRVCRSIDVVHRRGFRVEVDIETDIALFRVDGAVFAIDNVCRHKHAAVLAEGIVDGNTVTCPLHGWCYNIITGNAVIGSRALRTYTAVERDGNVYVNLQG